MTELPQPQPTGGRPISLTPDLQARIVQVVKAGNYLKVAAQYAGVGYSTLQSWLQRGRAAATWAEAHPPDRLFCPGCDLDRTEEVATLDALNSQPTEPGEPGPVGAVLSVCHRCRSADPPRTPELPPNDRLFLGFLEAVTQAETAAEVAAVTHWRAAFVNDWRAARDYLVRSKPDRWAATTRIAISNDEADARIQRATEEALTALGIDTDAAELMASDLDAGVQAMLDGDPWDSDDEEPEE